MEKIDVKRNFFELGGNSLLAIKVINTLNMEFSCKFTPVTLFLYPTKVHRISDGKFSHHNQAFRRLYLKPFRSTLEVMLKSQEQEEPTQAYMQ